MPPPLVKTRYQGSKAKLAPFLAPIFSSLAFDTALDLFSGTASVSYLLKTLGKRVHANDLLRANASVARALVVNDSVRLDTDRAERLFEKRRGAAFRFVSETFGGIYFLPEENAWLDTVAENIRAVADPFEKSLAEYALFQACLKKRPFNLFHRKNLEIRTRSVTRTFGNKTTWDAPFETHFKAALKEANRAVFDNGKKHVVTNEDALALEATADLVYLDPPYMNARGVSVDYLGFYHFLEGLTEIEQWPARIDRRRRHLPYQRRESPFFSAKTIVRAFADLFERHRQSTLVVSYRSDGIPSLEELKRMLEALGKRVRVHEAEHKYALAARATRELVLVAG